MAQAGGGVPGPSGSSRRIDGLEAQSPRFWNSVRQRPRRTQPRRQSPRPSGTGLPLHHQAPAALRPPGVLPAPPRAPLLPPARSVRAAPTRAHWWVGPVAISRSPHITACGQSSASGGGSAGTGMKGAPSPALGPAAGPLRRTPRAPIPHTVGRGGAEQTRPMASRAFVQWRAPPGRHEPRRLHGVWRRGGWWVSTLPFRMPGKGAGWRQSARTCAAPRISDGGHVDEGWQRDLSRFGVVQHAASQALPG